MQRVHFLVNFYLEAVSASPVDALFDFYLLLVAAIAANEIITQIE